VKQLYWNEETLNKLKAGNLPKHIAIIMDGNRRWAKQKGLQPVEGHYKGAEALKKVVRACRETEIPFLTVYAFSTENWKRPQTEINALMNLLVEYINKEKKEMQQNKIRFKALGKIEELPSEQLRAIKFIEEETKKNDKLCLNVALNYGGRKEILEAVQKIIMDLKQNKLQEESLNEEVFSSYLYTAGMPDPDLLIRTSGEKRLSNFLLWQTAYTEIWYTSVLWPDFNETDLYSALSDYQKRKRRFGGS